MVPYIYHPTKVGKSIFSLGDHDPDPRISLRLIQGPFIPNIYDNILSI
jgi:hypothetical protein